MKGLLIKDLRLMLIQKRFFLMMIIIAIGMMFSMNNSSFIFGYLTFVCSLFSISSISYDEFDNGNAFLFSLPITRKEYAAEKYVFGLIIGGGSWLSASVIATVAGVVKHVGTMKDMCMEASMIFVILLVFLACMLPFQLKFGGEKGKIAMIAVIGVIFLIVLLIDRIAKLFHVDLITWLDHLPTMSMGMLIAVLLGIAMLGLFVSYSVSVAIMNRKEF